MKFYVIPMPTSLTDQVKEPDLTPVVYGVFPKRALEAMGWDENTSLIMTVEQDGFWIREENPAPKEGDLRYIPFESL